MRDEIISRRSYIFLFARLFNICFGYQIMLFCWDIKTYETIRAMFAMDEYSRPKLISISRGQFMQRDLFCTRYFPSLPCKPAYADRREYSEVTRAVEIDRRRQH